MTITEDVQKQICQIIDADPILLSVHLAAYDNWITSVTISQVNDLLTLWDDNNLNTDFTRIKPQAANFGAEIDPDDLRDGIRKNIATLLMLHRAKWYVGGGSGTEVMMERG